jgi:hypothetical protein
MAIGNMGIIDAGSIRMAAREQEGIGPMGEKHSA